MIRVGSRFRITYRRHWGYGRSFICTELPGLRVDGNRDVPALVWVRGELIEFMVPDHHGRITHYVVPRAWCEEVPDKAAEHHGHGHPSPDDAA